jgi:hypothetical protein
MNLQYSLAAVDIGLVQDHTAVEPAGTQQRRVEDIGAVGSRYDDDLGAGIESIHLHQYLVERLLPLVMPAAKTGAAVSAHGIYFVHKDNAGGIAFSLVEKVAHTGSAHADEHLHELAAADREERHSRLTRDSPCHQGLACARRADE